MAGTAVVFNKPRFSASSHAPPASFSGKDIRISEFCSGVRQNQDIHLSSNFIPSPTVELSIARVGDKRLRMRRGDAGVCNVGHGDGSTFDDGSGHLCLFPLQSGCLPTTTGEIHVHEPCYLQMFEVIMEVARAEMSVAQFGMLQNLHSLDGLYSTDPTAGTSSDIFIGSCCHVVSVAEDGMGEDLIVKYKCVGRFMVRDIKINNPFHVAHVDWVTDFPPDMPGNSSDSGATRDRLELEVWQAINKVAMLTAKLGGSIFKYTEDWLPAQVREFAPMSSRTRSPCSATSNRQVAADIAIWRRSSTSGKQNNPSARNWDQVSDSNAHNPYWSAGEKLVKPVRQEAFSFAAASIVEAGPQERSALLKTRDTSARLLWILDAVQPYLKRLEAQNSLLEAMKTM